MSKILRDSETVNSLMSAFTTSRVTVLKALDGKSNSELAKKIRKRALDMGCRMKGEEKVKVL
ncbi:MAG: hypothetical protein LBV74_05365 [Tannerella sp.]|jgi:hypothetical protein|nr:hypothetical protein [Tannerella sp.]